MTGEGGLPALASGRPLGVLVFAAFLDWGGRWLSRLPLWLSVFFTPPVRAQPPPGLLQWGGGRAGREQGGKGGFRCPLLPSPA